MYCLCMDEKQTREQLIDKQLKTAGWLKKHIKEESVRSNFRTKEYVLSKGRNDDSGRFIDYLFDTLIQKVFKGELII